MAMFGRKRGDGASTALGGGTPSRIEAEALGYLNSLYGTALRLTRNEADAEDLVQEPTSRPFDRETVHGRART